MTSISGNMSAAAMMSPGDRMKLALQSAVSSGTVTSTDRTAMSGALDDIDTAMKAGGPPKVGTGPGNMKAKIDSLVDQEVKDGKLTDNQASELKQVFADAAKQMGGPGGAGGPPPGGCGEDGSDATDATVATDQTDTTRSAIEALIAFLKQLEQSTSGTSTYGASGTSSASESTASSLLVDANA